MAFDFDAFMKWLYRPGRLIAYTGVMESGKSHLAVALNEYNVKTRPECRLLTNMIFLKVTGFRQRDGDNGAFTTPEFEETFPQGVEKVLTLEGVFRKTGEILGENPEAVILLLLDEFQNFVLADLPQEELGLTFTRYVANLRKFKHCLQAISPSRRNIPRRLREFHDDPRYSGYLFAEWNKGQYEVSAYNRDHGTNFTTQDCATLKVSFDHRPELFDVPVTPWTSWNDLRVGSVVFDHLASATFSLGAFNFVEFMTKLGGAPHFKVPNLIAEFFEEQDSREAESAEAVDIRSTRAFRVYRMRELDLSWDEISSIEGGISRQTLYEDMRKHLDQIERWKRDRL